MKKLLSLVTLLVAFAAVSFAGVVKDVNGVKYYYVTGSNGFNNEGSEKLCDNDVHTKFCSNFDVRGAENSSWWVVIEADQAVAMTQYSICTANDNRQYTGRNPQSWVVQGTNDEVTADNADDANWEDIDEKEEYLDFPLRNYAEVVFKLDAATKPYKYFRFEVTEGNADIIQLSEFWVNEHPHTWGEATVTEPTCSNTGTSLTVCSDCNAEVLVYTPATGAHNFKGGLCTMCQEPANHEWILPNGQKSPYTVSAVHTDGVGQFLGDYADESGWDNAGYEEEPADWFTLTMPIGGSDGQGGYDGGADSGAKYNTAWHGKDNTFWIRRPFNLDAVLDDTKYELQLLHDDNIEIYVNGNLVHEHNGWTNGTGWEKHTLDHEWLNEGENVIAIQIEQNFGGCYLDFALLAIHPELKEDIYEEGDATADAILPAFKYGGRYGAYTAEYAGEAYSGPEGPENPLYNAIVGTPANDASGKAWYEVGYTRTNDFKYTNDRLPGSWSGNMGDIYAIRYFTVTGQLPENVFLAAPHDDAPCEYYINGQLIWSATDGWNEGEVVMLTAEQKALIKTDGTKNVFAFHVHQNWGGRYADGGLYGGGNVANDFNNDLKDLQNHIDAAKTDAVAMADPAVQAALADAANIVKRSDVGSKRDAIKVARKLAHAEKAEDVFEGASYADVLDGTPFYLYNVGAKRFFCGGDDWGAHAAVGYPGIAIQLEEMNGDYLIDTRLQNGEGQHYLNFGGYCDTNASDGNDAWYFEDVTVDGYDGAVYIVRNTTDLSEPLMLGYSPNTYARVDTDKNDIENPYNMWKIVTKEERDALMDDATADEPVDISHLIKMPNFNQREYVLDGGWENVAWQVGLTNGLGIYGRGQNFHDFAFECWNNEALDLYQEIEDEAIVPGWYSLTVQGYYRDGNREHHAAQATPAQRANLFIDTTGDELALRTITSVDVTLGDKGTGWNRDIKDEEGNVTGSEYFPWPDSCPSAVEFFQHGAYKNTIVFEVTEDGSIAFGVEKSEGCVDEYTEVEKDADGNETTVTKTRNNDWVVLDNFRLVFYGEEEPDGIQGVANAPVKTSKGIYNLNGQQIEKAVKGVNIINGRKYIVK